MADYRVRYIKNGAARPGTKLKKFSGVTLHEESGSGDENALHYANMLQSICRSRSRFSSHYFVDDKTVACCIPEDECAVHADDFANGNTIAITMCVYDGCDYEMLIYNTAVLTAEIFERHGIKVVADRIYLHRQFSNFLRNCPRRFMEEGRLASFSKKVQMILLSGEDATEKEECNCGCSESQDEPPAVILPIYNECEDSEVEVAPEPLPLPEPEPIVVPEPEPLPQSPCSCSGGGFIMSPVNSLNFNVNSTQQAAPAFITGVEEEVPSEIIYKDEVQDIALAVEDSSDCSIEIPVTVIVADNIIVDSCPDSENGEFDMDKLAEIYPPASTESESIIVEELVPYYGLTFLPNRGRIR